MRISLIAAHFQLACTLPLCIGLMASIAYDCDGWQIGRECRNMGELHERAFSLTRCANGSCVVKLWRYEDQIDNAIMLLRNE